MRKCVLITFLSFILCGVEVCAKSIDFITIETAGLNMFFTISENKKVSFLYFGDRLVSDSRTTVLNKEYKLRRDGRPLIPEIFPTSGDFLDPALQLTHADGVFTTDLYYLEHNTINVDDNVSETIIRLKDKLYPLFVNVVFKAYKKENIIAQYIELENGENDIVKIEKIASAYLPLHRKSYYLTHFYGGWGAEMKMKEERLTPGTKSIEARTGILTTESVNSSFMLSADAPAQEGTGEIYAGSLAWSGNYKMTFELDKYGMLHMVGGINPYASMLLIEPGKKIKMPEMIWTYSSCGRGQISRNYHDWCRKYALAHGNEIRPVVLNSWEGTYFKFDEKKVKRMIDAAADFGIEMFVLDDGWFGNKYPRDDDRCGLGDWQVNKKKLPGGIGHLADYAHKKGIKFGIWVELEMVNPKSELAEKHPEWIVRSGNRELLLVRSQCVLDLTNPEVQDFIVETFDDIVSSSPNISYIKWDSNRFINRVGSEYLPADKQSHFWVDYINGLYSVYDRVRKKYPHITIQLCSSGGGRLDFGALKYHDEVWASDNTNPLSRIFIQYGTNMFFPAIATGAHVSISPNHQTKMHASLKYRFDVAMAGRLGMELQPEDLQGDERIFAKNAVETYKQIRPIVQFGDLYRLISPYDEGGWAASMYVDKDKKNAVVFAYSFEFHGRDRFLEFKLDGLDEKKKYKLTELNRIGKKSSFWGNDKIFTGEELMKMGINVNDSAMFDSFVFMLTEVN